jgi:hypothetical protein
MAETRRRRVLENLGMCAWTIGFFLLLGGGLQRYEGALSAGGSRTSPKTLAREENPRLFDQVTIGMIASGLLLSVGGLALGWLASDSGPARGGGTEAER